MDFTVYIIYSASLDRFYVGYTADEIQSRLYKHNANHRGFTGKKSDWIIKHTELFASKQEAMHREREIKKWKSRRKIELLISIK